MPATISACFRAIKAERMLQYRGIYWLRYQCIRGILMNHFSKECKIYGSKFLSAKKIAIFFLVKNRFLSRFMRKRKIFRLKLKLTNLQFDRRANYPIFPGYYIFSLNNKCNWIVTQLFKSKKSGSPPHHCIAKIKSNLGRKTVRCLYRKRRIEKSRSFWRACSCFRKFRFDEKLIAQSNSDELENHYYLSCVKLNNF